MSRLEEEILKILQQAEKEISGSFLAKSLQKSRTAIWKAIKRLKNKGLSIAVTSKGYLLQDKDLLPFWELPKVIEELPLWERVVYEFEVPSTMDVARSLAEDQIRAVVIAERQTQGRGRLGREWLSPSGGLWLTLILLEPMPLREAFVLPYLSALAVAEALEKSYRVTPELKWPNDVLLQGKKVAGILLELNGEADYLKFVLIGIGVNLNNPVSHLTFPQEAISVSELLGGKVDRFLFLKNLLHAFAKSYEEANWPKILSRWKELSSTLGKKVRVQTLHGSYEGLALDLDDDGALILQSQDQRIKVYSGDCFHLR